MKITKPGRNSLMAGALWLSLILAMFASMHHVADQFGWLERPGNEALGWAAAIAIDAGILALAYGLRTRRKANRSRGASFRLWAGVFFLTGISITANFLAAQAVRPEAIFQAVAFSATLPVIVILLADVVSSDDEKAARKVEQVDERLNKSIEQLNIAKAEIERLNKLAEQLNAENERLNIALNDARVPAEQNGWHEAWAAYLVEHPNASQRELAEHFKVSVGTVNNRMKKLNTA
jgi:hypothetical protein